MKAPRALFTVKLVHTGVWLFFATCIVAVPFAARMGHFGLAGALIVAVLLETCVLLANRGSCPLTAVAARYTKDRNANFDIFLPLWLARNNKRIFGTLYLCGLVYTGFLWLQSGAGT